MARDKEITELNFTDFLVHEWLGGRENRTRCGITREEWVQKAADGRQWAHPYPAYTTCPDCIAILAAHPSVDEAMAAWLEEQRNKARRVAEGLSEDGPVRYRH